MHNYTKVWQLTSEKYKCKPSCTCMHEYERCVNISIGWLLCTMTIPSVTQIMIEKYAWREDIQLVYAKKLVYMGCVGMEGGVYIHKHRDQFLPA